MTRSLTLGLLGAAFLVGCGAAGTTPAVPTPLRSPATSGAVTQSGGPLVVFLGDSLTAGLGLGLEQAYPALVADELASRGLPVRVVNAGVSGDTTAGGLARLDWVLQQRPDVLVVGLGANDGLRGQPLSELEGNLRRIVERGRVAGAEVLLLGMQVPRSLGPDYADGFADVYPRLAQELGVPLVPFLLEGVAGVAELNLEDGIHPNAEGHRRVAETVATHLETILNRLRPPPRTPNAAAGRNSTEPRSRRGSGRVAVELSAVGCWLPLPTAPSRLAKGSPTSTDVDSCSGVSDYAFDGTS